MTEADKKKVEAYRQGLDKYPKPSCTADIVAVRPAYGERSDATWRNNPEFALEILLVKRGQWPYEGCWALPGGFIRPTETVDGGARRELMEEASLKANTLIPVGVFSKPGRDMRAWIISNAFVSVHARGEGNDVKGGDDAAEAKWFRVVSPVIQDGRFDLPFFLDGRPAFSLSGTCAQDSLGGGRVVSVEKNPMAFDHAEIIATAFLRMLAFDPRKLAFFFLPEKFTLANYIDVYRYLTHEEADLGNLPNLRRQLTETKNPLLVVCPGEFEDLCGRGHARAKLYRRADLA